MWGNTQIIKFALLLATCGAFASGQAKSAAPTPIDAARSGQAAGALAVTATVITSVVVILGSDGQQKIVVANGSDSADNISRFVMLPEQDRSTAGKRKKSKTR